MTRPSSTIIDCREPKVLAQCRAPVPSYKDAAWADEPSFVLLGENGLDQGSLLPLQRVEERRQVKNGVDTDVCGHDPNAGADRLLSLGARSSWGRVHTEHVARSIVMTDPEGNEFCVCAGVQ